MRYRVQNRAPIYLGQSPCDSIPAQYMLDRYNCQQKEFQAKLDRLAREAQQRWAEKFPPPTPTPPPFPERTPTPTPSGGPVPPLPPPPPPPVETPGTVTVAKPHAPPVSTGPTPGETAPLTFMTPPPVEFPPPSRPPPPSYPPPGPPRPPIPTESGKEAGRGIVSCYQCPDGSHAQLTSEDARALNCREVDPSNCRPGRIFRIPPTPNLVTPQGQPYTPEGRYYPPSPPPRPPISTPTGGAGPTTMAPPTPTQGTFSSGVTEFGPAANLPVATGRGGRGGVSVPFGLPGGMEAGGVPFGLGSVRLVQGSGAFLGARPFLGQVRVQGARP